MKEEQSPDKEIKSKVHDFLMGKGVMSITESHTVYTIQNWMIELLTSGQK